jgi:solute carrier family 25, member 33/36
VDTFSAAALAKLIAAVVTYPHEVFRTRMRQEPLPGEAAKYVGLWRTARIVHVEEGFRGWYGGLTPHLLRVVPNAVILFSTVEFILQKSKVVY